MPEATYKDNYDKGLTEETRGVCILSYFKAVTLGGGMDVVLIFRNLIGFVKDNRQGVQPKIWNSSDDTARDNIAGVKTEKDISMLLTSVNDVVTFLTNILVHLTSSFPLTDASKNMISLAQAFLPSLMSSFIKVKSRLSSILRSSNLTLVRIRVHLSFAILKQVFRSPH